MSKPAAKVEGPKYGEICKAAIMALKDRTGTSMLAITKYIAANYPAAKNTVAIKAALKAPGGAIWQLWGLQFIKRRGRASC